MDETWIDKLRLHVEKRRLTVLRLVGNEWKRLCESRLGVTQFTITRAHDLTETLKTPTLCLIFGKDETRASAYLGIFTGNRLFRRSTRLSSSAERLRSRRARNRPWRHLSKARDF